MKERREDSVQKGETCLQSDEFGDFPVYHNINKVYISSLCWWMLFYYHWFVTEWFRYVKESSHQDFMISTHPLLKDKLDYKIESKREALFSQLKEIEASLVMLDFEVEKSCSYLSKQFYN